jgi:hypothetical protein
MFRGSLKSTGYPLHQFPLHFPSHASPCAITFQLDPTRLLSSIFGMTKKMCLLSSNVIAVGGNDELPPWTYSNSMYSIYCRLITLVELTFCVIFNMKHFNVVRFDFLTVVLMQIEIPLDMNTTQSGK